MESILLILILVILVIISIKLFFAKTKTEEKTKIVNDIYQMKSIGELSVFQVFSKEIVTKKDSTFNGVWESILGWSLSKRQIALIFEFEISFLYDLRDKNFKIIELDDGHYKIIMPECKYKHSIIDMQFYDEKNAKLLPFLLPDLINNTGFSFSEEQKNKLIKEAKEEVKELSLTLIKNLESKIHKSAEDTLMAIAKGFGAKSIEFEFKDNNTNLNVN
ncbi:DUF4230 domain-containing protein [Campylobacter canadensis]|uniref:DUF4230 domain-containing protein n=1 Tax=Campylobacter canadensis TaxID=449520 RepID=A0ABS7WQE1_9BACT|nr:DUF4230 domain-containing protein [Campylobacter canadensis]MBZ7986988.1 DUF4230 domain-containing protein [Campylobacter canadensis]MBZ7995292.1 DUF4230 domain-containing protein [Campylobacter canadensis]MBZ7997166.1 DUF4230 domain-containing protein [Campylobacter canadensis]MBZ7998024.1 DUF4230 domain-containing protein [Campylobacter canadensis]MBZ8000707.1 DUF4230 domain-containing protein [Campylobacter canadensis]